MAGPVRFPNLVGSYGSPMGPGASMGVGPERRLSVTPEVDGEGAIGGVESANAADSARGVHRPFSDYLNAQIQQVNGVNQEADTAVANMVTGRSGNLHETMLALDKADEGAQQDGRGLPRSHADEHLSGGVER